MGFAGERDAGGTPSRCDIEELRRILIVVARGSAVLYSLSGDFSCRDCGVRNRGRNECVM